MYKIEHNIPIKIALEHESLNVSLLSGIIYKYLFANLGNILSTFNISRKKILDSLILLDGIILLFREDDCCPVFLDEVKRLLFREDDCCPVFLDELILLPEDSLDNFSFSEIYFDEVILLCDETDCG
jgi:hypothetical protein